MIHYLNEMPRGVEKEPAGGHGEMSFVTLFRPEELGGRTGMFAAVTLEPGNTVGEHVHDTDSEVFYVLSGQATMIEDGKKYPVSAGDIEYCPKGHSHGIENHSDGPMTFLALQFKDR